MVTECKSKFKRVPIQSLQPSPENDDLYGAIDPKDIDLINLANDIAANGLREPIQISADHYIVSGHRRYNAAKLVKLAKVPIVRLDISRADHSAVEWQRVLRAYNHQRVKSSAMRMKETLLDIDPDIAHKQLIAEREVSIAIKNQPFSQGG